MKEASSEINSPPKLTHGRMFTRPNRHEIRLKDFKVRLKESLRQVDILITTHGIQVICVAPSLKWPHFRDEDTLE
jgi:hypothetical protein